MRNLSLGLALFLLAAAGHAQSITQFGPQSFGCSPGTTTAGNVTQFGCSSDVYADATATYSINDSTTATSLGFEGGDAFAGNSMDGNGTGYADGGDIDALELTGSMEVCYWIENDGSIGTRYPGGKASASAGWFALLNNATNVPAWGWRWGGGTTFTTCPAMPSVLARVFVCGSYTDAEASCWLNDVEGTPAVPATAMTAEATNAFRIADIYVAGKVDGSIGPFAVWSAALSDAIRTSLHNSTKGKRYASLTAGEKTNLVGWWEWDATLEQFIDQHSTNDLTSVSSPATEPGLVIEGDGDPTLYLTPVASPTGTGGALGYSTHFDNATGNYADGNDILDSGSGVSWGFAGWVEFEADIANAQWVSKLVNTATDGDYRAQFTGATNLVQCMLYDGTANRIDSSVGSLPGVGVRFFAHCRYNATANEIEAGFNATWSGSPVSTTGDGADTGTSFNIGKYNDGFGATPTANYGPTVFYRSVSGGEVLTDAITTSLYNSYKGKTCADLVGAELTNLVSCWEMDEDGGPYADSVGSNTLTGVNTPTRDNGLVERSDSGMGAATTRATDNYFEIASDTGLDHGGGSWSCAGWIHPGITQTTAGLISRWSGVTVGSWRMQCTGASFECFAQIRTSSGNVIATTNATNPYLPATGWSLLGFIIDASGETVTIRHNDETAVSTSWAGDTWSSLATADFTVSNYATTNWDGATDNWACWPFALSDSQWSGLYAAGAGDFIQ